ncbi:hypothetical protein F5J12DRAFT_901922 [Pisolithus orientalis]|uniref:uncharacterized protein n=1 Tax=Pisolithus orientalis TaxID=936130 RepID=UPI0022243549|nr:uncharacterized protein F5J12DRAFT_901922 [Pisolithus orientalis]KAI6035040.1 hypothetical protein F5J12DRAFT_901922 [Pisolithus orientalis]
MAQTPAPSNVTISLLPVSLSLVHIPRSRLPQLTHPILRQILQPNTTFFNVTCNEIELTLFAEHHNLADLDLIARQDRQLHRSRSGSGSSRKRALSDGDRVEITCENWNVLQIDSHSDQLDNSGARVHELSAPLAAAGISILYQSSYRSDFIFVKESRLHQVLSLLRAAGFDLYSSDAEPFPPIASPLASPPTPYEMLSHELGHEVSLESGAVLTRSVDTFVDALSASQKLNSAVEQQKQTTSPQAARSKSRSPSPTDVSILSTDLACVGLSDENMDNWALKIVKLVAFSDLIPLSSSSHLRHRDAFKEKARNRAGSHSTETTATSSSDEADDGYVSHSPIGNEPFLSSPASHSYPDLSQTIQSSSHALKRTSKCLAPLSSKPSSPFAKQCFNTIRQPVTVPFFSFTRTSEGFLPHYFPPSERHMLSCAGELEALADSPSLPSGGDWEESDERIEGGTLKCLQIDLRRFGLDKHGLVNRYSRVLEQNGINHMYSSTYKTANLLVAKVHASRAHDLLQSC